MKRRLLFTALAALAVALPPAAAAGDNDEVRTRAACAGARVELRVRADDEDGGELRLEVRVERSRPGATWRIALLRERRLVFTGTRRAGTTGRLEVRRTVVDWPGRETVAARLTAPNGRTCSLTATI